jgi:Uma2 family endonuclease
MAGDTRALDFELVREADGRELARGPWPGRRTEAQARALTDHTRRLSAFADGAIEALPRPTDRHQVRPAVLDEAVLAFIRPRGGKGRFAPLRRRIRAGQPREPDILLVRDVHGPRRPNRDWPGADLVAELVSPDGPERDLRPQRAGYAEAGIPEYWIVAPDEETITVLALAGDAYAAPGRFRRGASATSVLLAGFAVSVDAVFDAR